MAASIVRKVQNGTGLFANISCILNAMQKTLTQLTDGLHSYSVFYARPVRSTDSKDSNEIVTFDLFSLPVIASMSLFVLSGTSIYAIYAIRKDTVIEDT